MAVRRDLQEREPGVSQTNAQLGRPGAYDLVFRLNQPPLYHCFSFDVVPATTSPARQSRVAPVRPFGVVPVGEPAKLEFMVTNATGGPVADLSDLTVLVMTSSWQMRQIATPRGDGRYDVHFVVPEPGAYAVAVRSIAAGIDYQPMPGLTITAAQ
jgi:hypothetical protein